MSEQTHQMVAEALTALHAIEEWRDFYEGGCGPAAIALNEELLDGRGSYAVVMCLEDGAIPLPWTGHVAVYFDSVLFDYYDIWTWPGFARCMDYTQPVVLVDVSADLVREHFLIHWEHRLDDARELVRSVRLTRSSTESAGHVPTGPGWYWRGRVAVEVRRIGNVLCMWGGHPPDWRLSVEDDGLWGPKIGHRVVD